MTQQKIFWEEVLYNSFNQDNARVAFVSSVEDRKKRKSMKTRKNLFDIRNHGFFRVAAARNEISLASPRKNVNRHIELMTQMFDEGVHLAVFPEMGLTGYMVEDLNGNELLLQGALEAVGEICRVTELYYGNMIVAVGAPLRIRGMLINAAIFIRNGKILAVYPKAHLPNYREFYDARWFTSAHQLEQLGIKEMNLLGQTVPVGTDILIEVPEYPGVVIHAEVCEDGWMQIPPSTHAANAGATILCNLSASNETIGKDEYRHDVLLSAASAQRVAIQIYSSLGWGESTRDLVWGGDGYIAENGKVLAEVKRFQLGSSYIVADVRPETLLMERQRQTTFKDNAAANAKPFRTVVISKDLAREQPDEVYTKLLRKLPRNPFVPDDVKQLYKRAEQIIEMQAIGLATRMRASGLKKIVIGISGGLDSTLALLVAVRAMDILGISRKNIICVTMPGFGTTSRTRGNAEKLCLALGVTFREHSIVPESILALQGIGHPEGVCNLSFENVQARQRTVYLFHVAGEEEGGAIVLGTGDLSELALGWCTFNGDHMSLYNVNGSIPKTLVKHLVRWAAEVLFTSEAGVKETLLDILDTPVSPELLPPDANGVSHQNTEEIVGPYALHDVFLYYFVRFGFKPSMILFLTHQALGDTYDLSTIHKWLGVFISRFFSQQYKRDTVPPCPKVGSVSLSPRGDWRMPPEAHSELWFMELDQWDFTLPSSTK